MEDTPFATCVVDASVLVKLLVPEVGSEQATALLANARGAGERAIPNLAWMECTNALWKCERREKLLADIARQCLADLLLLPLAVELALARGVAVYDAMYVALAMQLDCLPVPPTRHWHGSLLALLLVSGCSTVHRLAATIDQPRLSECEGDGGGLTRKGSPPGMEGYLQPV